MTRNTAVGLSVLTFLAILGSLTSPSPLSYVAGIGLAFLLPGAALTALLFRNRGSLSGMERFTLIPALSLATLVLGGLLAWLVGVSLERSAWLAISSGVTFAALLVSIVKPVPHPVRDAANLSDPRVRLPTAKDHTLVLPVDLDRGGSGEPEKPPTSRLVARVILPFGLVALMLGGAGWLSYTSSRDAHDDLVTTLSASPPDLPDAQGRRQVRVTATGLGANSAAYSLVVTAENVPEQRMQVQANPEGTWETDLVVPGSARVTINLLRQGDANPYRTVVIAVAPARSAG